MLGEIVAIIVAILIANALELGIEMILRLRFTAFWEKYFGEESWRQAGVS